MNYRCYQMALQSNIFTQSGAVRSVGWIFIVGVPEWQCLGKYVTLDRMFYSLLLKQKALAAQLLPHFVAYRIPRGGLHQKYNNYTVCQLIICINNNNEIINNNDGRMQYFILLFKIPMGM